MPGFRTARMYRMRSSDLFFGIQVVSGHGILEKLGVPILPLNLRDFEEVNFSSSSRNIYLDLVQDGEFIVAHINSI